VIIQVPAQLARRNQTVPLYLNEFQITLLLAILSGGKLTPEQKVEAKAFKSSLRECLKYSKEKLK
jgi:hypothetical protein